MPDSMKLKNLGMGCGVGDTATWLLSGATDANRNKVILFRRGRYEDLTTSHPALKDQSFVPSVFDNKDSTLYMVNTDFEVYAYRLGVLRLVSKGPATHVELTDEGPQLINALVEYKQKVSPFINEMGNPTNALTDMD
ncbi:MAG: hypothetical protein MZV63_12935, partial [Marinilabiliales bacterium]|nr:hypothetical protein [Marinilabiliales bacterium]